MGRMTLANFRSEVEANLGNQNIGTTRVDIWIHWALDEITGAIKFQDLTNTQSKSTVADQSYVTLDSGSLGVLAVRDTTNDQRLIRTSDERIQDWDTDATGVPRFYAYYGGDLELRPVPDAVYALKILVRKEHATLTTTTSLPAMWDPAITMLATGYACMSLDEESKAMWWFNRAIAYIRSRETDAELHSEGISEPVRIAESWADVVENVTFDFTQGQ